MWQLINREIGKAPENEEKLELRIGNKLISNPTEITDKLNTHFKHCGRIGKTKEQWKGL